MKIEVNQNRAKHGSFKKGLTIVLLQKSQDFGNTRIGFWAKWNDSWRNMSIVYFDQQLGAPHSNAEKAEKRKKHEY